MIRLLNNDVQKSRFYIRALLCILVPAVIGRGAAVMSLFMTNVTETASALLHWTFLAFWCLSNAAALTLIAAAIYTGGKKCAVRIMVIFIVCRGADAAAAFAAEGIASEEQISDYETILSVVSAFSDFIVAVSVAFGVWIIAAAFYRVWIAKDRSRKYSLRSAVNTAILLNFSVPFVRLLVRTALRIISPDIQPTVTGIGAVVSEGVEIFVFYAIIAFAGSRIALAICTKREF